MPKRITAEIDMNILRDVGLGLRNIDIAKEYDVSPSYVSKVKRGKKIPDMYVLSATTTVYPNDDVVEWLEIKLENSKKDLHIYTQLLNKIKGE